MEKRMLAIDWRDEMITSEALVKANAKIKSIDVKGKGYVMVNERIKAFREICPNGSITTEIVSLADGVVVMKSTVSDENGAVLGTGLAYEKESSSFINKTSYIENCETSAVGRALGMCGIGIDDSVASAEELVNAVTNQKTKGTEKKHDELSAEKARFVKRCSAMGQDAEKISRQAGWKNGDKPTMELYAKCNVILDEIEYASA